MVTYKPRGGEYPDSEHSQLWQMTVHENRLRHRHDGPAHPSRSPATASARPPPPGAANPPPPPNSRLKAAPASPWSPRRTPARAPTNSVSNAAKTPSSTATPTALVAVEEVLAGSGELENVPIDSGDERPPLDVIVMKQLGRLDQRRPRTRNQRPPKPPNHRRPRRPPSNPPSPAKTEPVQSIEPVVLFATILSRDSGTTRHHAYADQ